MIDLIDNFLNYKLKAKNLRKDTLNLYTIDLRDFEKFIKKDMLKVEKIELGKYIEYLKSRYKHNSISRKISTIKGFYKYLLENSMIEDNPTDGVYVEQNDNKVEMETLEFWEIESILNACGKDLKSLRDKIVIEILVEANLTINDILTIRISELAISEYKIILSEDKQDKVEISEQLSEKLKEYISICVENKFNGNSDFLFNGLSRQNFRARFMKYGKKAEIEKNVTPNMLRNTTKNIVIENDIYGEEAFVKLKRKYFEIGIGDD